MELEQSKKKDCTVRIITEVYKRAITFPFTREERKIFDVICLKTYGYNKKKDWITTSQFEVFTLMKKANISRAKTSLKNKKIIFEEKGDKKRFMFSINENTNEWIELANKSHSSLSPGITKESDKTSSSLSLGATVRYPRGQQFVIPRDNSSLSLGMDTYTTIQKQYLHKQSLQDIYVQQSAPEAGACVCDNEVINLNPKDQMKEIKIYEAEEICKDQDRSATDDEILRLFNEMLGDDLRKIKYITNDRKAKVKKRIKDLPMISEWIELFIKIQKSDFLCGRADKWKATFDWIIKESNLTKILEDNYENRGVTTNADRKPTNAQDRYDARSKFLRESLDESIEDQMQKTICLD